MTEQHVFTINIRTNAVVNFTFFSNLNLVCGQTVPLESAIPSYAVSGITRSDAWTQRGGYNEVASQRECEEFRLGMAKASGVSRSPAHTGFMRRIPISASSCLHCAKDDRKALLPIRLRNLNLEQFLADNALRND